MACTTAAEMAAMLARRGGVVAFGSHTRAEIVRGCSLCILELDAACRVERLELAAVTDNPQVLGLPDFRSINDGPWSSREAATPHLLWLHAAYAEWSEWSGERRLAVAERAVIETVRRITSTLPLISPKVAQQCRLVSSMDDSMASASAAIEALPDDDSVIANLVSLVSMSVWAARDAARYARVSGDAALRAVGTVVAFAAKAQILKYDQDSILIDGTNILIEASKGLA